MLHQVKCIIAMKNNCVISQSLEYCNADK